MEDAGCQQLVPHIRKRRPALCIAVSKSTCTVLMRGSSTWDRDAIHGWDRLKGVECVIGKSEGRVLSGGSRASNEGRAPLLADDPLSRHSSSCGRQTTDHVQLDRSPVRDIWPPSSNICVSPLRCLQPTLHINPQNKSYEEYSRGILGSRQGDTECGISVRVTLTGGHILPPPYPPGIPSEPPV
ncbi:hypothetical protein GWK47_026981 [Chionoecetes opilio]|uniref:Uncharacterized protein n=1 Tax=Chionoecetes opilio TaxID=41210 RepID=A0A8J8WEB8_CHIOP|nr:hypothetical protein GWK47_026981 [Chionoecetes opilio]